MIIFPAIDLKEGRCVRLVQGKKENETVYSDKPGEMARFFQEQGAKWLHVVDLDGAFSGQPVNFKAIKDIAKNINIPFQAGGGLRQKEDVNKLLDLGASRVILGTKAVSSPDFMQGLLHEFGSDRIVLGIDAREGMVAIEGWVETATLKVLDFACSMKDLGVRKVIFTDISRDGMLQGPNFQAIEEVARVSGLEVIASGGISSIRDISILKQMEGVGVKGAIIGKALYDGKISMAAALAAAEKE